MSWEAPSAAVLAILARRPNVLPPERSWELWDDDLSAALAKSRHQRSNVVNPFLLAATTNQPQIVESLIQLIPETYTLDGIRKDTDAGSRCSCRRS